MDATFRATLARRRLLVLAVAALLTAAIHAANTITPPSIRLAQLYLVPVMLVTWFLGLAWGSLFTLVAVALRVVIEREQLPGDTMATVFVNQLSFLAVATIAMLAFRRIRYTQAELTHLAQRDPLTRLFNARAFVERLGFELKRSRRYSHPVSVLYLDLDDFKRINDSRGHETGDAVLRLVAEAIRRAVRQPDVVGRLGGDEFAVLMPETGGDLAEAAAARLAAELRQTFQGTPTVTASVGIVSIAPGEADVNEVLRRGDQAMYDAKRKGKDRAVKVTM